MKSKTVCIGYWDYDDHMAPLKDLYEKYPDGKIDLSADEGIYIELPQKKKVGQTKLVKEEVETLNEYLSIRELFLKWPDGILKFDAGYNSVDVRVEYERPMTKEEIAQEKKEKEEKQDRDNYKKEREREVKLAEYNKLKKELGL